MPKNAQRATRESVYDVMDFLQFAGFDVSREQLTRLHRRGLIGAPLQGLDSGRSTTSWYPAGTAVQALRIAQLRSSTKQLDELAWRLWWEGYDLEPDLVRHYLVRKAERWDEQLREVRSGPSTASVVEDASEERDVLDDVFFRHLKPGPALVSARKRLMRESELYAEFAGLVIDLLCGELSTAGEASVGLFTESAEIVDHAGDERTGSVALAAMRRAMDRPFAQMIESLEDKEIEVAREIALRFVDVIGGIGRIMQDAFGGTGRGRDNVGVSLMGLSENPEEQVLALLLTSAFLEDDRIRARLPDVEPAMIHRPGIEFRDFIRLRFLAARIPGVAELVRPERIAEALESPEGASEWRRRFDEFRRVHALEIEASMIIAPELFVDDEIEDDADEVSDKVRSKKKTLK